MTEIPESLLNSWAILRFLWYRKIIPKDDPKQFKVYAWKVAAINVGDVPQYPVALTRITDSKSLNIGFQHFNAEFVVKEEYIKFAELNNYKLISDSGSELVFTHKDFDS